MQQANSDEIRTYLTRVPTQLWVCNGRELPLTIVEHRGFSTQASIPWQHHGVRYGVAAKSAEFRGKSFRKTADLLKQNYW